MNSFAAASPCDEDSGMWCLTLQVLLEGKTTKQLPAFPKPVINSNSRTYKIHSKDRI